MAVWPWESAITACASCGFNGVPTFRQERRIAYRETGERGTDNYSRELSQIVEVMVCLQCGHVQDEELIVG